MKTIIHPSFLNTQASLLAVTSLIALGVSGCRPQPSGAQVDAKQQQQTQAALSTASKKEAPAAAVKPKRPAPLPAPSDVKAAPAHAEKSASGLQWTVLQPGTGTSPEAWDSVEVHYTGWTTDGKMFDSSVLRGKPATFPLKQVIPGWTEGVGYMKVGEKRRFWIPGKLAYGEKPMRPGAPAGTLVFDVELLKVIAGPKPISAPTDVSAAPKSATTTASGLAYRHLNKGNGSAHPQETSMVQVHYTGWTTDGKMFDSSVQRGRPATFGLNGVIKGWTEGVQLMVEGQKTRFWIPGNLAYGDTPKRRGAPSGTLVFDVELLKIMPPRGAPAGLPTGHPKVGGKKQ